MWTSLVKGNTRMMVMPKNTCSLYRMCTLLMASAAAVGWKVTILCAQVASSTMTEPQAVVEKVDVLKSKKHALLNKFLTSK